MSVLRGAKETLANNHPKIIVELHPGEEDVETSLQALGYRTSKPSKWFLVAQ